MYTELYIRFSFTAMFRYLLSFITGCEPRPVQTSVINRFLDLAFGPDWPLAHFDHLVFPTLFLIGFSIAIRHWILQTQTSVISSFFTFLAKLCSCFFLVRLLKLVLADIYELNAESRG